MRARVSCPTCSKAYLVDDHLKGKLIRCKQCNATFKPMLPEEADKVQLPPRPTVPSKAGSGSLEQIARFQIRARLGAGAFGTVYKAFDPQLDREVALKVPQAGVLDNPKRVERFLREAKSAAQLRHPNIVPIYDAGQEDGHHFIASAFIEGHTLSDVIGDNGINLRRAAIIVMRLAEALAYAHHLGIVHRDIKPANVMLDPDDQPHLMDFGLAARTESTEKLTQDGAVLGTPAYMAPEHAAGHSGDAVPVSDQYSLGVVLYELLTGKTPWEGLPQIVLYNVLHKEPPKPRSLRPGIPRDLETICLKAMAKDPVRRYADCQEMADDLRRWLDGEPIKARRPGFVERCVRWMKREPKIAAAGLLALIGTVTLASGLGLFAHKLQGDYDNEQTAHGTTKKSLTDEATAHGSTKKSLTDAKADHELTKGDRYSKQVGLANEQIHGHDLPGAMHTLAACPPELRAWEWGHLRQLAEGSPDVFHVLNGKGRIFHVHFTADSKQLLGQNPQGVRMAWDLATLKGQDEKQKLSLNEWSNPSFSGDGKLVAELKFQGPPIAPPVGDEPPALPPAKLTVREVATNAVVREIDVPGGMNLHALSRDGAKVAIAHAPKFGDPLKITIHDVQTGQEANKIDGEFKSVVGLVFSPDAASLAVVQGGGVTIAKKMVAIEEDVKEGNKVVKRTVYKAVEETVMNGEGGGMKVIDAASSKELVAVNKGASGMPRAVFAPDGKRVCLLHGDGVDVYNLADGKELFTLRGCAGAIAFSPDGKRIATASGQTACAPDGLIKLWDAADGRFVVAVRTMGYTMTYHQLLFSPDGSWLAAVPEHSSQIFLFSTGGGRLLIPYNEHGAPVASVVWSPDGKLLSSWSDCNQTARVWNADDGKTQLVAPRQFFSGLGFSTDGNYLSTGGGCVGAVPHGMHGGHGTYGAYGGHGAHGGGCYGMQAFDSVKVFSVTGFKAVPPPKGYDSILAASKNGTHWVLRPIFDAKGKVFTDKDVPRPQLWSVADDKEVMALSALNFDSQVKFTDDGNRIVGISKGPAKTTANKNEYRQVEKMTTVREKTKDGRFEEKAVKIKVTECVLVPYEVTVFASHLKLLDTATGNKVWQSYGVHDLYAVSSDGKLVATLPPQAPMQAKGMPPQGEPIAPQPPKAAPKKLPAETKSGAHDIGFVSFQEPKKVPAAQPPTGPVPIGPGDEVMPAPMPMIPSPPVTLWAVDAKDKDGETQRRTLPVPGEVTMMKFSPDGNYLAAYVPRVLEQAPEMRVRKVFFEIDGKRVEKEETYTVMTKRQYSLLMVFETSTGKEVVRHVGASGLAIFCNGSGHLASASGLPKFGSMHGGGVVPMDHDDGPPPPPKAVPAPEKKVVSAGRIVERANSDQGFVMAQKEVDDFEPFPVFEHNHGMHGPHGGPAYVDTALCVFDLKTGKQLHRFHGHASQITALAFTSDCQKLASGSYGNNPWACFDPPGKHYAQINIWDLGTKKLYQSIAGHTGKINCMDFDPEGKRLASASDDTTVKVWKVEASLNTSSPTYAVPAPGPGYAHGGSVIVQPEPIVSAPVVKAVPIPAFKPIPAPKLDAAPGSLVFDDALATPAALDKFFHAGGQYGGAAFHEPPLGVRLGGGHASPIAWAKPFLGSRYRVEFEVQHKHKGAWAGWCLSGSGHGNSADSGYRCWFDAENFWFQREGKPAQQTTKLPKSVAPGAWVKVLAEVDGDKILVILDDMLVARFTDPAPLSGPLHGWFGLHAGEAIYRNLKIWSTVKDINVARQLTPPSTMKPLPNGALLYELKLTDGKLGSEWHQTQPSATTVKDGAIILHEGNASPEIVLTKPLPANFICDVEFEYASLPHEAVNFSVLLWHSKQAPKSPKEADGGWLIHLPAGDGKSAIRWHRGSKDAGEGPWTGAPILVSSPYHAPIFKRKYVARIETQGDAIRVFLDGGLLLTTKKPAGAAGSLPVFLGLRQIFGGSTIRAVRVYAIPQA